MRFGLFAATSLLFGLAACGQGAPPADAQGEQAVAGGSASTADQGAMLRALSLTANAGGLIENECGERVAPQFLSAELGGAAGTGTLVAISGGPNMATCYGDGPDLHLFVRDGAGWREVYSARGRMLIILPTSTSGVHDLADGGPGFSFPVWTWNGTSYGETNRSVADSALEGATFLP